LIRKYTSTNERIALHFWPIRSQLSSSKESKPFVQKEMSKKEIINIFLENYSCYGVIIDVINYS
jgi:hypothetical protein